MMLHMLIHCSESLLKLIALYISILVLIWTQQVQTFSSLKIVTSSIPISPTLQAVPMGRLKIPIRLRKHCFQIAACPDLFIQLVACSFSQAQKFIPDRRCSGFNLEEEGRTDHTTALFSNWSSKDQFEAKPTRCVYNHDFFNTIRQRCSSIGLLCSPFISAQKKIFFLFTQNNNINITISASCCCIGQPPSWGTFQRLSIGS